MIDYEIDFEEFELMVDQFCYNKEMQLTFTKFKIEHFMKSYYEESTDSGRETCLKYIAKLNNLYTDLLIEHAYETLSLDRYRSTEEDIQRRHDVLISRFKASKDLGDLKAHSEIQKAYDILQCFKS